MAVGTAGQILKVVLIVVLIILLVIEIFTLFVGLAFVILPNMKKSLVHYGLYLTVASALLTALAFVGLCGAVRECYLKLFVFAGLLIAFLLVSLLAHLYMLGDEENSSEAPGDGASTPKSRRSVTDSELYDEEAEFDDSEVDFRRKRFIQAYAMPSLTEYNTNSSCKDYWDQTQQKWSCCGLYGPKSWLDLNMSIPSSCYQQHNKKKLSLPNSKTNISANFIKAVIFPERNSGNLLYLFNRGCEPFRIKPMFQAKGADGDDEGDKEGDDKKDDDENKLTMIVIVRTASYFLQVTAVVLAIWLGVLILLSYNDCYYCY